MSQTSSDKAERSTADNANAEKRSLRQRIPYRMLGRRLASTKRLVVSSKVWLKTIPTHDCDVLLTFPGEADDSALMWLLARLRARTPQLVVHVRHHSNSGIYGFYMTANYENLLRGAEELGLKKQVKSEYGGGMREFIFDEQDCFAGIEEERSFLSSQERQSVVRMFLYELRATDGEQLDRIHFRGGQPIIPLLESKRVVSQVFPLHSEEDLTMLKRSWVQAIFKTQPLDDICNYFGVKIALYFAYLGHYTTALCIPAFFGVVLCFFKGDQNVEDMGIVVFSLVNMLWATLYLEHWKRTSAELAYRWGTLDQKDERLHDPRPLYKGDLVKSSVTGRMEPHYPAWKRQLFRYCVSVPVTSLGLAVVFVVMLLVFELQEWINAHIAQNDIPSFLRFIPKILLALSIGFLDEGYKKIAIWLNKKENYRLEEHYANQLILKLVLFVNSFLSLFYIAFYLQDMDRLRDQLAALLITRQVVSNLKEALLPYLIWKVKLLRVGLKITGQMSPSTIDKEISEMTEEIKEMTIRRRQVKAIDTNTSNDGATSNDRTTESDAAVEGETKTDETDFEKSDEVKSVATVPTLTQAEVESAMQKYEDTYEDFLEMFIQFGYVILFSSAFPLAALCALLNNVIEIRTDAFKLCINHQRPFGKQVESIGIWQNALEALGLIAVVVNCALIGQTGLTQRMIPGIGDHSVIFLIVLEHLVLILKIGLAYAIPDIPEWVAMEMAKIDFQRREALKRLESQNSPGISSPDLRSRRISENSSSTSPSGGGGGSRSVTNKTPSPASNKLASQDPPVPPPRRDGMRPIRSSTYTLGLIPQRSLGQGENSAGSQFIRASSESPRSMAESHRSTSESSRSSFESNRSSSESPRSVFETPSCTSEGPSLETSISLERNPSSANTGAHILSYENPSYCGVAEYHRAPPTSASDRAPADRLANTSTTNPFDPAYTCPGSPHGVRPPQRYARRPMSSPPISPSHSDHGPENPSNKNTCPPLRAGLFENEQDRMIYRPEGKPRRFSFDELNRRNSREKERMESQRVSEEIFSSSSISSDSRRIVFRGGNVNIPGSIGNKRFETQTFHVKKM